MATYEFPLLLLHEASHDWNLVGNAISAGQTVSASVDVRSDGGGFWTTSLNDVQLWDRFQPLLWRAVRQLANGGVNRLVVSRRDQLQPWPGNLTSYGAVAFGDGALFDDGAGFEQSVIDVVTSGAAALRATSLVLDFVNCGDLLGGEAFSIDHQTFGWRMYEIGSVEEIGGGLIKVTFNPPLREAVADGTQVEFDRPRCVMKLQSAAAMNLNLTVLPYTKATVKLVEAKYQ
ncbi:hypothetical protein [Bradyrhizobium cosmicum]|uniref:Uncharacterized protein n=1 Tax=Bradyrhizobium cosmicum TaxID=1404864 RepID=A0AAI8MEB6_9BRAD|nr:hypothetical protein [Bradyrhizobium cosmicum]BAL77026.1 hypothetical protein S23_38310 [Bradyrhizobium cosmicum]